MIDGSQTPVSPRWLHLLAVLTVLFTLPLLFLGAGVTSYNVGMVDPQGFRTPLAIINGLFEDSGFALRLEYGHRIFGFLVGMCGIALAIGAWFFDKRTWLGWLAVAALTLICIQGVLGIFRVDYNALHGRAFAMIHGMFAQIVFATLVCVALFTSRRWLALPTEPASPALQRFSIVAALLVFVQLLLGGLVRHQDTLLGPRGHLLGAFVVTGAIVWLLKQMYAEEARDQYRRQAILLKVFLVAQVWLGIESWLARFNVFNVPTADLPQLAPLPTHAEWIRTLHYLVGTLLFSTTVAVALSANRRPVLAAEPVPAPPHQLEAAR